MWLNQHLLVQFHGSSLATVLMNFYACARARPHEGLGHHPKRPVFSVEYTQDHPHV